MINWAIWWKMSQNHNNNEDYKSCFVKIKDEGEKVLECAVMKKVK